MSYRGGKCVWSGQAVRYKLADKTVGQVDRSRSGEGSDLHKKERYSDGPAVKFVHRDRHYPMWGVPRHLRYWQRCLVHAGRRTCTYTFALCTRHTHVRAHQSFLQTRRPYLYFRSFWLVAQCHVLFDSYYVTLLYKQTFDALPDM